MELRLNDEYKDSVDKIKIDLVNADTTLITPIIEKLNANKDVKIVRFIETHPELDTPALYVEMKDGKDAKDAVIKAAKELSEYYGKVNQTE